MHPKIQVALNNFHAKIASRAPQSAVDIARKAVGDAMEACSSEDKDGDMDMSEMGKKVAEADEMAKVAGYHSDRPGPASATGGNTGFQDNPGFAPDVKDRDPVIVRQVDAESRLKSDGNSPAVVTNQARPWMVHADRILAEADSYRRTSGGFDPDSSEVKSLRAYNRKAFINPLIEQVAARHHKAKTAQEWFQAGDALLSKGERALADSIEMAASDSVTTANLFNQPTISAALIIQEFQDMEALQWVHGIGPEINDQASAGGYQMFADNTGQVGAVLRVPSEYYTPPVGYGASSGTFDAGLATPENIGIDEATINIAWQSFAPTPRQIAVSLTRAAIRAMGNGPLNYGAVARALFHIAFDKSRRIDKALYDEMLLTSDEYGAVTVATETANLTNNSAWLAGGFVKVNLNTAKTASAAVVATDPSVTYGANVNSAIRLQCGSPGAAAPFAGTSAGVTPLCRPRVKGDLNSVGQFSTTTSHPFTLTVPGGGVEGYLDGTGNIQDKPGAAGANYAIDYNNGVLVAKTALIGGAAGVVTTVVTVAPYTYVTNFDNFVVNNPTLATGETPGRYYNRIFNQLDLTGALMGSSPRYIKPNLCLGSLNASTWVTAAEIFFNQNSPRGTSLFPTENYYFERTGIKGARINSPWNFGDSGLLLVRNGTTKYAIDTPFEIKGPFPSYDANGKIIAKDLYYGYENSVICTPQVVDQNNNILNPVSRKILLR